MPPGHSDPADFLLSLCSAALLTHMWLWLARSAFVDRGAEAILNPNVHEMSMIWSNMDCRNATMHGIDWEEERNNLSQADARGDHGTVERITRELITKLRTTDLGSSVLDMHAKVPGDTEGCFQNSPEEYQDIHAKAFLINVVPQINGRNEHIYCQIERDYNPK